MGEVLSRKPAASRCSATSAQRPHPLLLADAAAEVAVARLMAALGERTIPRPLISQYLAHLEPAVASGAVAPDARVLLLASVTQIPRRLCRGDRGYFTIGILQRSMVMATASDQHAPKTMCWAKMLTPRKVMPMRTTEMISAPTSVRQMLPTPPVIAVPPTTTAAIDGRSSSFASVGEPRRGGRRGSPRRSRRRPAEST